MKSTKRHQAQQQMKLESLRHFEHKLVHNIKSDCKSFCAYIRSKHNVRDKVGPL